MRRGRPVRYSTLDRKPLNLLVKAKERAVWTSRNFERRRHSRLLNRPVDMWEESGVVGRRRVSNWRRGFISVSSNPIDQLRRNHALRAGASDSNQQARTYLTGWVILDSSNLRTTCSPCTFLLCFTKRMKAPRRKNGQVREMFALLDADTAA